MNLFPKTRRLMLATALFAPCLLFTAFLLFARGLFGWAVGAFVAGMIISFMFSAGIIVSTVDTDDKAAKETAPMVKWAWWIAKMGSWIWLVRQPELMNLLTRIAEEGALWDRWIIVPLAIATAAFIYDGISRVSRLPDKTIYRYFADDDRWQTGRLIRNDDKAD